MTTLKPIPALVYSPSSIINVLNNAISIRQEKKLINVRGVYKKNGHKSYNGYYYDILTEEGGSQSISVVTHEVKRAKIESNKVVELQGVICRKVTQNSAISVYIKLDRVIQQKVSEFSIDDEKRLKICKNKSDKGFKDIDQFLKRFFFDDEKINLSIISGNTSIIDNDIKTCLGGAIRYFNIDFRKASLTSKESLLNVMSQLENAPNVDLIAVARGGGANVDFFDNLELCESVLSFKKPLISAIGHEVDKTLFSQISDRSFSTPTALGTYLNEVCERYVNEVNNSQARIIEQTKKTISKQFEQKIKNLEEHNFKIEQRFKKQEVLWAKSTENLRINHTSSLNEHKKMYKDERLTNQLTIKDLKDELRLANQKGISLTQKLVLVIFGLMIGIGIGAFVITFITSA